VALGHVSDLAQEDHVADREAHAQAAGDRPPGLEDDRRGRDAQQALVESEVGLCDEGRVA
jgi:hypothetical protein